MKHLMILLAVLACCSCKDTTQKKMALLVQEWNDKEILFPEKPVFTRFGTDTASYEIPRTGYKVVVFVDSMGCISCKLQLPKWKEFMAEVDSLVAGEVPFVFFFQSKDIKELRNTLRRDDFSHPVCIDTDDAFNDLNHFPDQMTFQSFLVDADNRVKVIGNPIHNLLVKELYLKRLTGISAKIFPVTTLRPDSAEYHYGTMGEGETRRKEVTLVNTGNEPFRIQGVTTSCDCTSVEYDWEEIKPGGSAAMTVNYKAEEAGDFWRTITIYGNVPGKSITLDFWGTVK